MTTHSVNDRSFLVAMSILIVGSFAVIGVGIALASLAHHAWGETGSLVVAGVSGFVGTGVVLWLCFRWDESQKRSAHSAA